MKENTEKKISNLVEKVDNEGRAVYTSAIDSNAKNTKEYYETLKKILEENSKIDENYKKYAEKEVEFYIKALDTATSDEERKEIYLKMKTLHDNVTKVAEKVLDEGKNIKERATKETEENKQFNWSILVAFGLVALTTIGAVVFSKEKEDNRN